MSPAEQVAALRQQLAAAIAHGEASAGRMVAVGEHAARTTGDPRIRKAVVVLRQTLRAYRPRPAVPMLAPVPPGDTAAPARAAVLQPIARGAP